MRRRSRSLVSRCPSVFGGMELRGVTLTHTVHTYCTVCTPFPPPAPARRRLGLADSAGVALSHTCSCVCPVFLTETHSHGSHCCVVNLTVLCVSVCVFVLVCSAVSFLYVQESSDSSNTTIEDEDVKGRFHHFSQPMESN